MNEKTKKAAAFFAEGFYCSQAILGAFCETYGMERETAFRISCGLNSGARCAELCGAVSGAVLVIGLKYGDSKDACNLKTEAFIKSFQEKNGDVVCRAILGCDIFTLDGREKAVKEKLYGTTCVNMVISAAQILEDSGY
ncbi:MAG: C-GCAxxG-C-C family protein [Proteobacteria bacterium]|nr:C-GCAxxG-C-C family protein [Pseudomonadota bacterium]MCL2307313.1 C-GCAxxG-C-C family protein [Pseudomonadota bacterium]